MKRRGFFGLLAGAVVAGPAAVKAVSAAPVVEIGWDAFFEKRMKVGTLDAPEDYLSDMITMIKPQDTPFMSLWRHGGVNLLQSGRKTVKLNA